MGFWLREKKDGQKTAGYGVYLTAGVLAIGLVIYAASKVSAPDPTLQGARSKRAVVKLGDAQTAATSMQEAKDEERPLTAAEVSTRGVEDASKPTSKQGTSSTRSGPSRSTGSSAVTPSAGSSTNAPSGGIESINVAMRIAEDAAKPQLDETDGMFPAQTTPVSRYASLPKTVWMTQEATGGENGRGGRTGNVQSTNSMVVYSAKQDKELVAKKKADEDRAAAANDRTYVLPRGEWIRCYLLTTVEDGNLGDTMVELGVAENVYFNHRLMIPFGTRLFASANGRSVRMRMGMAATSIRYPNGLELPLSGAVRGEDRTAGVPAYYIAASDWAQLSPFVSSFLDAWIEAEKQSARGALEGGILGALAGQVQSKEFNPGAEAGIAAATGLNDLIKARIKDVQERFGARMVIPAGTVVWVQLTSDANLAMAHKNPDKPWVEPLPESTQYANLARAISNSQGTAANVINQSPEVQQAGSAIDRLIQATAVGDVTPAQAEAAMAAAVRAGQKTTPASVITPTPDQTAIDAAADFFPKQ